MRGAAKDVDTRPGSCLNIGNFDRRYSATGAPAVGRTARVAVARRNAVLTAEDIARLTGSPLRTVRDRLTRWRRSGGPVVLATRVGRGRRPLVVSAEDYARRIGVDLETLAAGAS